MMLTGKDSPTGGRSLPRVAWPRVVARGRRLATVASVVLLALALPLAGCGESKEEQAKKTVCAAKSDIQTRIQTLKTLTPSVAALPQVKTEVSAIAKDLEKITGAQEDLSPSRKAQVKQATQTFEQQVSSVLSSVTSSLSLSGVESQLKSALQQLESSYASALGPIECS
jgi:hypothetical protein